MTEKLQYILEVGASDNADTEEIEEFLQQVLLDLYEQGQVESIRVTKDGHTSQSIDDVEGIKDAIDRVDSEAVRKAIDSVWELEQSGDSDG